MTAVANTAKRSTRCLPSPEPGRALNLAGNGRSDATVDGPDDDGRHPGRNAEVVPLSNDAVMWHNYDQVEAPADEATANFAALQSVLPDYRFEDVRAHGAGEVSVAQYVLKATLPDGTSVRAPGCFVVHEPDGQIVRIDEYMDSAQVAPIGAAVAAVDTAQELLALKCSALAHGPRRRSREMMARAGQTPTLP